jgi:condensin complex subunit 1
MRLKTWANQYLGAQTAIIQNLTYFEHLSEPMAEFLNILSKEFAYDQLAEEVLKELANKEFHSTDSKGANDKGPKSVSVFLTKISELQPKIVYRHMTVLATLLESEVYHSKSSLQRPHINRM